MLRITYKFMIMSEDDFADEEDGIEVGSISYSFPELYDAGTELLNLGQTSDALKLIEKTNQWYLGAQIYPNMDVKHIKLLQENIWTHNIMTQLVYLEDSRGNTIHDACDLGLDIYDSVIDCREDAFRDRVWELFEAGELRTPFVRPMNVVRPEKNPTLDYQDKPIKIAVTIPRAAKMIAEHVGYDCIDEELSRVQIGESEIDDTVRLILKHRPFDEWEYVVGHNDGSTTEIANITVADKLVRFKDFVEEMTNEWNEKDGFVTIEFSTNAIDIAEKMKILHDIEVKNGKWIVYYCDTCAEDNPEQPYHCEIVKD